MLGNRSAPALVKREAAHDVGMHCCTDWRALVSKSWPTTLKEVFAAAVKVINFSKSGT